MYNRSATATQVAPTSLNELYFLLEIFSILLFCYASLRLGKEALIAAVCLMAILANLFVLKQINFFGLEITCGDPFAVGSILCLNLLREYFDQSSAKKAIAICFLSMSFFVIMSKLHLLFVPNRHDAFHGAYSQLLSPAPRLLIASLATFFIVQQFDLYAFSWISSTLSKTPFYVRGAIALLLSQLVDTLLFTFLGLYGLVANPFDVFLISFLLKGSVVLILTPLMTLFKRPQLNV